MEKAAGAAQQLLFSRRAQRAKKLMPDARSPLAKERHDFFVEVRPVVLIRKNLAAQHDPRAAEKTSLQRGVLVLLRANSAQHDGKVPFRLGGGGQRDAIVDDGNAAQRWRAGAPLCL